MTNKHRPFAMRMKIGPRPTAWEAYYVTKDGTGEYIWYRGNESDAQMILPSDRRPPEPFSVRTGLVNRNLSRWKTILKEGAKDKTLGAYDRRKELEALADGIKEIMSREEK